MMTKSIFTLEPLTTESPRGAAKARTPVFSAPVCNPTDPMRAECTAPADASAPVDIPPLPKTLMTVEVIDGMHFIRIDCPAVRERQAFALTDPLCQMADHSNGKMTLDLIKVAAFSCAWINVLITVAKRCKAKGGSLVLTGLSSPAKHSLKQMGLLKQFTMV